MRATTRFHRDDTGGQLGEEGQHLNTFQLLAKNCSPREISPVDLKEVLGQIEPNCASSDMPLSSVDRRRLTLVHGCRRAATLLRPIQTADLIWFSNHLDETNSYRHFP